jgi:tRNA pseudouridine38-40 synthase
MQRYKITIEYDGTAYAGWQRQKHSPSVQQAIEEAIFAMTSEAAEVTVAGRTDAGVHARGQVAHFDLHNKVFEEHKLMHGLNYHLLNHLVRHDIAIIKAEKVTEDFNARFSAKKRYYKYYMLTRPAPSPINKLRAWHVYDKLNIAEMMRAAKFFEGTHDFSSFRASECQANNTIRTLDYINIHSEGEFLVFEVCGKSFLHNMVRNIVGTLKQVGTGHLNADKIPEIIAAKNRQAAGLCAPAHGLYFEKVEY